MPFLEPCMPQTHTVPGFRLGPDLLRPSEWGPRTVGLCSPCPWWWGRLCRLCRRRCVAGGLCPRCPGVGRWLSGIYISLSMIYALALAHAHTILCLQPGSQSARFRWCECASEERRAEKTIHQSKCIGKVPCWSRR